MSHITYPLQLTVLFIPTALFAADFSGPVPRILNGDTIEGRYTEHPERIRLSGIDRPEKGRAYGHKAKEAASALVFGKNVTLQTHGKDKYGRTLVDVRLLDRTHINHMLVGDGWCWWYRTYAPNDRELKRLESEARPAKRGLWVDPYHVPPWKWRKTRDDTTY